VTIEELQLEPVAEHAARLLQQKHPNIEFTSDHPNAVTIDQITVGLLAAMNPMPETELLRISRHLTGRAFDIRPVTQNAAAIENDIRLLPGLQKFLDKEGGHVRWHAQF